MSVLRTCPDCGAKYETGIGPSARTGPCRQCERRHERLASGGLPLTARERAATAAFLGLVVPDEGAAYEVEGHEGAMTWGHGGFTDHATLDGERAALLPEVQP